MPAQFLLDENLRGLLSAIASYNRRCSTMIDVVRVGDFDDLPLGSQDPDILEWADLHSRILISGDHKTMIGFLDDRLATGAGSPGLFLLRPKSSRNDIVEFLSTVTDSWNPAEWFDQAVYIP